MRVLDSSEENLRIEVDAELYPESVVFKCFYWYAGDFDVQIDRDAERTRYTITLTPLKGTLDHETRTALERRVRRDLVDFKTRSIVSEETHTVRALLIAKAFAPFDDLDQPPPGRISDPVGFEPERYEEREASDD